MKIFDKFFNNKTPSQTHYEMVTENGNGFYMWNGKLFQSDIIRACIRPTAKAVGKLVAKHIRTDMTGIKVNPEPYLRFLLEEPNPYMTGQVLQEKLATQLVLNNNAFAVIIRDEFGYATEIYPIPATTVEAIYDKQATLYLKFYFKNGKQSTFPYSDIIHLRQDFNDNDVFGDSPAPALTSLLTKSSNKVYKKNEEGTLDKVDDMIEKDINEYITNLNKVFNVQHTNDRL